MPFGIGGHWGISGTGRTYKESGPRGYIKIDVDQRDLNRAIKTIDNFRKQEYMARSNRVFYAGAKMIERPIKAATPRNRYPDPIDSSKKRTRGLLRDAVFTRRNNLRFGELAAVTTGPTGRRAPHRYLVVRGTKAHSLYPTRPGKKKTLYYVPTKRVVQQRASTVYAWRQKSKVPEQHEKVVKAIPGKNQHPGSQGVPYVDMVMAIYRPRVISFIESEMTKVGHSPYFSGPVIK